MYLSIRAHLHRPGAVLGRIHTASISHKLQHLLITAARVRHVAQREDFPKQNSKWPKKHKVIQSNQRTRKKLYIKKYNIEHILTLNQIGIGIFILQHSPCICFWGEDSLHKSLRGHPFDRQHSAASFPVIAGPVQKHTSPVKNKLRWNIVIHAQSRQNTKQT